MGLALPILLNKICAGAAGFLIEKQHWRLLIVAICLIVLGDVSVNRGILSKEIVKIKNQELQTSTSLILHYQHNQQVKFFRHH